MYEFNVPKRVIVGKNTISELSNQVNRFGIDNVLVVTDNYLVESGLAERVEQILRNAGCQVTIFANVQPEPVDQNVLDGLNVLQASSAQLVVGLGGGSPMDVAKLVSVMANHSLPLREYKGYHKFRNAGLPLILIPTTAGTGSEVTKVVVVTDQSNDEKMMLLDVNLLPDVAIIDYQLSMSMPPSLTAHVGLDTLTHGIEAYVSKKSSPFTDPIALSCIKLCAQHLENAYIAPDNEAARNAMMSAATQGGMAFSNSSVCLVHGMSRPIGACFHVPHGLSNAVLLPEITKYSMGGAKDRYAHVAEVLGVASRADSEAMACDKLLEYLYRLNDSLKVGTVRDAVNVDRTTYDGQLSDMATAALDSGSPQNNPVVPSAKQIIELYKAAW